MTIDIDGLVLAYGPHAAPAVDDLSLSIEQGKLFVLLGPSGCGKTTTMRCVAGLEVPNRGRISINGKTVLDMSRRVNVPTHKRQVGMVFQSYAIWPHKTVYQNVAFPLQMQGIKGKATQTLVSEVLGKVGLGDFEGRSASQLSGGQMQRVALARSIAMQPSVLLFDEPLSNLDARLRENLRFEIRALQQEFGFTSVYVTHDQSEALALGDEIAVMRSGRIVQQGSPTSLYYEPKTGFVAEFLGVGNRLAGEVIDRTADGSTIRLDDSSIEIRSAATRFAVGERVLACIRDEALDLAARGDAGRSATANTLPGSVNVASFLGAEAQYQCRLDGGPLVRLSMSTHGHALHRSGDLIEITFGRDAVRLVPAEEQAA